MFITYVKQFEHQKEIAVYSLRLILFLYGISGIFLYGIRLTRLLSDPQTFPQ